MRRIVALVSLMLGLAAAPLAAEARVNIQVDLASQSMHVTAPDGSVHRWAISSGRKGFRTPTGHYASQRLARMHYSRKYDDAPMPHSIFFRGGYAIHATSSVGMLGRPASHGCIRLAPAHAAQLFAMVKQSGASISIAGAAPGDGRVYAGKRAKTKAIAQAASERAPRGATIAPTTVSYGAPGFTDAPRSTWSIDGRGAPSWILR